VGILSIDAEARSGSPWWSRVADDPIYALRYPAAI